MTSLVLGITMSTLGIHIQIVVVVIIYTNKSRKSKCIRRRGVCVRVGVFTGQL